MKYILDRLYEKSTWVGLAGVVVLIFGKSNPELESAIITAGLAIMSVIAILTKEKS